MKLVLRSIFFALLLPGSATLLIPYLILAGRDGIAVRQWGPVQFLAVIAIAGGVAILVWCISDFARIGRGTLAPVDPPKELVVRGLYRYVRNPMYLGVLTVLLGETLLFRSLGLMTYTAIWFLFVNLFVIVYEEPALRARFGDSYEQYRRSVGRWIPGRTK